MPDDIFPVLQPRIEAVKARLPQLAAGLEPRRGAPIPQPPAAFQPIATGDQIVEEPIARWPLEPSTPRGAMLRRFSSTLPVAPPPIFEAPARPPRAAQERDPRRDADIEDIGDPAPLPPPTAKIQAAAPGAAYHLETSSTSAVSEATARGAEPPSLERRFALVASPQAPVLRVGVRAGGVWLGVLFALGFAVLLLSR